MSAARICDNPDCESVSTEANPDGWLALRIAELFGADPRDFDACSRECAVVIVATDLKLKSRVSIKEG